MMTAELKQSTRKADRLIHQLGEILLRQGELSAMLVCEPHSNWHPSPIHALFKRRSYIQYNSAGEWSLCVWSDEDIRENSATPLTVLNGLFRGLGELVIESRDKLPEELRRWASLSVQNSDFLWGSFVAGFATTSINGHEPRTHRKCWGPNNSFYPAEKLDCLIQGFKKTDPNWSSENMPPNADCWLVRTDSFIQWSIDAIEYLVELKTLEPVEDGPVPPGGFRSNGKVFAGLQPIPWRLMNHAWQAENHCAIYDNLATEVWNDKEYEFAGEPLKQAAGKVRKFFKDNGIPFNISVSEAQQAVTISPKM